MIKLLLILSICVSTSIKAKEASLDELYSTLYVICQKHPEFKASSIDFYEAESSKEFEVTFYKLSIRLHQRSAISFLLKKRELSNSNHVKCIDNILNTWSG